MAAVSQKAVYDDDIICLSSSDDEVSEVSSNGILKSALHPSKSVSRTGGSKSSSSKTNGCSSAQANKHFLSNYMSIKDEDGTIFKDDEFEIEYSQEEPYRVPEVQNVAISSDEDVRVLNGSEENASVAIVSEFRSIEGGEPLPDPSSLGSPPVSVNGEHKDEEYVKDNHLAVEKLLDVLQRDAKIGGKDLKKVRKKFTKALDKIKYLQREVHENLRSDIVNAMEVIRNVPSKPWTTIKNLLELMKPDHAIHISYSQNDLEKRREKEKQLAKEKLEREMAKIHQRIAGLDEEEVDWDDEDDHNSAYILADKLKKRFVDSFYRGCDAHRASRFTDRPIQKKINLKKCGADSPYEQINAEVEKFLNKKGFLFIPDFKDIHNIFIDANKTSRLNLNEDTVWKHAKDTFTKVVRVIKIRRQKDHTMTLCDLVKSDVIPDPADEDEELRRKLEENDNDKDRKTEAWVLDYWRKRQEEEGNTAEEVVADEDIDVSPPPSDNEDDEEDNEYTEADEEDTEKDVPLDRPGPDQDELIDEEDDDETDCYNLTMDQFSKESKGLATAISVKKITSEDVIENGERADESQSEQPNLDSTQGDKRPLSEVEDEGEPPLKRVRVDNENDGGTVLSLD